MNRFDEVERVLEKMSARQGLFDEVTYGVLLRRYATTRKVKETIDIFCKTRKEFGLELDLAAFQKLLMWLCRNKLVGESGEVFDSLKEDFDESIKTMNIILDGWCILGDVHEAKRFWKKILASDCKPCDYTYCCYIKALTKKGKLGTAMKLFQSLWENGNKPDVAICNLVIDALCFKKRIPEALEVFSLMKERGCSPNVVTYNTFVKHMCKIHRMDKVEEILNEMASTGGDCSPNSITYGYMLSCSKKPEEVSRLIEENGKRQL
ncbi:hypothetical protein MLD38_000628 [Melastoma candidum]|uniref:Uncharacterized protein n=1 Tax=Melastoma candidum TaxID=119954 RepID=A0ACB9SCN4_9MYRT|nr:hypothetical protein MLD38_000628 [Melastoma candidum]